jgi:uncharacterized metal-binding protein YceD (DUF177 family)
MTPEMSRIFPVDRVGEGARFVVEGTAAERQAVAQRLGLVAVHALTCGFELTKGQRGSVVAEGQLRARVVQTCVVSLEPFDTTVQEDFRVRFVPAGTESDDLDLDADDEIPFTEKVLDLGEAATEQLALALEPFPRKPGAALPAEASEMPEGPFAKLLRLDDDS